MQLSAERFEAFRSVVADVYELSTTSDGRLVRDVEEELEGVVIERVMGGTQSSAIEPTLKLHAGDRFSVAGRREQVIQRANDILGPECADSSHTNLIAEARALRGQAICTVISDRSPVPHIS